MKNALYALARKNPRLHRVLRAGKSTLHLLRHHGLRATYAHTSGLLHERSHQRQLDLPVGFPAEQTPSWREILNQKNWSKANAYRPRFSLVVPLTAHSPKTLEETIKCVQSQTYSHWTLSILHQAQISAETTALIESFAVKDSRIQSLAAPSGQSPIESLNAPLTGPQTHPMRSAYVGVIHEGDRLSIDALFQAARMLETHPELDALYTDEIHINPQTREMDAVVLKPDWSPEMLLGYNYLGSLSLVRQSLLIDLGGYRPEYGEAQHWDLHLRLLEAKAHVQRLPRCCYFRSTHNGYVPQDPARSKTSVNYRQVLTDYVSRQGLSAEVETCANGVHRLRWQFAEPPLVSIIIPNKNSLNLIRSVIDDLLLKTSYPNKEMIIVDNESTSADVKEYYREQIAAGHIQVVPYNEEFNYSAACNRGAALAQGDYLLFLNNDVEVQSADWLHDMVGMAALEDVGVVGTKLVYPDGELQHGGVMYGICLMGLFVPSQDWGVFGTSDAYRNCLAVMGACQMLSRKVFDEIGGFDERYKIACSDVAICLRAWKKGYRTVYSPYSALVHHEGLTRGKTNPLQDMECLARDLRQMQVHEDPYYHPLLNSDSSRPRLRAPHEPLPWDDAKRLIHHFDPPEQTFAPFTWSDTKTLQHELAILGVQLPMPLYSPENVATDSWEAARFVLNVLCNHKSIRDRFPSALSDGKEGAFCNWLCEEGLSYFRVPAEAAKKIREVFQDNPGQRIHVSTIRPDLKHHFPTALLPTGQREFVNWLLRHGVPDQGLRHEQIWWFFLQIAEDPAREFEYIYRTSPQWQQNFPAGLTPFGCDDLLSWAKDRHKLDENLINRIRERIPKTATLEDVRVAYLAKRRWQALFPDAFRDKQATVDLINWLSSHYDVEFASELSTENVRESVSSDKLGLNVLGHFCYPCGLRESMESIIRSLEKEQVAISRRDIPASYILNSSNREGFLDEEIYDVSLIHVGPDNDPSEPYLDKFYNRAGLVPRKGVYRVGYWYWELEDVPKHWAKQAEYLEELWAPTEFIAEAFRKAFSTQVTRMLPGVQLGKIESVSRSEFGVAEDDYLFLFMFDMKSYMERKNPLGLISAYQQAFRHDDRAKLVVKVSDGKLNAPEQARLRAAAEEAGVILIDEVLSREKSYGLIQACDCYVSLHRSEGLGLTMAEAMLLGKPVIGTGYSGNLDFMNRSNSMLVDYELRQLGGTCPEYVHTVYERDAFWAHPSVEHAASLMRSAYEHQDDGKAMGLRARDHVTQILSPKAAGERMQARLQEIYTSLEKSRTAPHVKKAA